MMPEKKIITSETSNSSPLNPSSSRIICHVCNKQFSQYTCPRCNFRYCSLTCYKSHSVQCTESFMKENVNNELRKVRSDDQTKAKMLEILKRFHSEEEEDEGIDSITDDEDSTLPKDIIQKIMNGEEVSLDDLSLEERKGFQRALASGELSKMIEPWDPWWFLASARTISLGLGGTQLVQCVGEEKEDEEATVVSEIPRGPNTPLISLSKLSSTNPSPFLPLHLIDIVYSYCFTLRIYNGEWQSDSLGSATMVLSVSSVLGHNGQPEAIKEVLSFSLEQTCSSAHKNLGGGLKFGLNLVDDVIRLLSLGTTAMVCLLCDLQRLILGAIQEVKSSSGRDLKKKLKLAERKVYFMMCWVNVQSPEVWQVVESSVRAEKNSLIELNDSKEFPEMKKKDEFRKGSGVVIEEIE